MGKYIIASLLVAFILSAIVMSGYLVVGDSSNIWLSGGIAFIVSCASFAIAYPSNKSKLKDGAK